MQLHKGSIVPGVGCPNRIEVLLSDDAGLSYRRLWPLRVGLPVKA